MYASEMMTIVILFQQSHYRIFKAYYTEYVQRHLRSGFPMLVSYQRFVELMPTLLVPLVAYLRTQFVFQLDAVYSGSLHRSSSL
jgi:hypothetical protein